MKNKKTSMWRLFSGLALVVAIGVASCAKDGEVGAKGDTGAQGPQGTPGAQGPAGPAGAPGAPGTANVYYSAWTDVAYVPVKNQLGDTLYFQSNITAPKLVDSILQKGEVKVYFNLNTAASPTIIALPSFDPVLGFWVNVYLQSQKIYLNASENLSTVTITGGAKAQQYRYIIIPGGTTGRTSINWNDYAKVKQYLNLKD